MPPRYLASVETSKNQIKYVMYVMPRTPYYGLVVQNGPYSVSKYRSQKDHYWQGGGLPAGGRQHAGHANWLQVMQYPTRSAFKQKGIPESKALPEVRDWDNIVTMSPHEYAVKLSRGVLGNRRLRKFPGRRGDQPPEWFKKFVDTMMPGQMPNDNGQVGAPATMPPPPPTDNSGMGPTGQPPVDEIQGQTETGELMDVDNYTDEVGRQENDPLGNPVVQTTDIIPEAAVQKASTPTPSLHYPTSTDNSPVPATPSPQSRVEPRGDNQLLSANRYAVLADLPEGSQARPEEALTPTKSPGSPPESKFTPSMGRLAEVHEKLKTAEKQKEKLKLKPNNPKLQEKYKNALTEATSIWDKYNLSEIAESALEIFTTGQLNLFKKDGKRDVRKAAQKSQKTTSAMYQSKRV